MTRLILSYALLLLCGIAGADEAAPDDAADAAPEAKTSVTEHAARIGPRNIEYTATAGTMLMKNAKDEPIALMGYTAYVKKGENAARRPILFAYRFCISMAAHGYSWP